MRLEEGIFTLCDLWLLTFRVELCVVLQQELRQRWIVEIGKHGLSSVKRPNGVKIFGGKFKVINREVLYETFAVHRFRNRDDVLGHQKAQCRLSCRLAVLCTDCH